MASGTPIGPVSATATRAGVEAERLGGRVAHRQGVAVARSPVAAFAFPELTTAARIRARSHCSLHTLTGAAAAALRVRSSGRADLAGVADEQAEVGAAAALQPAGDARRPEFRRQRSRVELLDPGGRLHPARAEERHCEPLRLRRAPASGSGSGPPGRPRPSRGCRSRRRRAPGRRRRARRGRGRGSCPARRERRAARRRAPRTAHRRSARSYSDRSSSSAQVAGRAARSSSPAGPGRAAADAGRRSPAPSRPSPRSSWTISGRVTVAIDPVGAEVLVHGRRSEAAPPRPGPRPRRPTRR